MDSSIYGQKLKIIFVHPSLPQPIKPPNRNPSAPKSTPSPSANNSSHDLQHNLENIAAVPIHGVIDGASPFHISLASHKERLMQNAFRGSKLTARRGRILPIHGGCRCDPPNAAIRQQPSAAQVIKSDSFQPNVRRIAVSPTKPRHGVGPLSSDTAKKGREPKKKAVITKRASVTRERKALLTPIKSDDDILKVENSNKKSLQKPKSETNKKENIKPTLSKANKIEVVPTTTDASMNTILTDILPQYRRRKKDVKISDIIDTLDMIIHPNPSEDIVNILPKNQVKRVDLKVWNNPPVHQRSVVPCKHGKCKKPKI